VRKAVAAACVVAAAGAAAAVAWLARPDGGSARTLAPIPASVTIAGRGSSLLLTFSGAAATLPAPRLSAFRAPRRAADALPPQARALLAHVPLGSSSDMVAARGGGGGAVEPGRSRLLLAGLGRLGSSLYAAPTGRGFVCFVLVPEELSRCVSSLSDGLASLSLEQTRTRTIATGVVADRVRSVALVVGGDTRPASVGRNGFFGELPGVAAADVDALLLTTRDGERLRLPLDRGSFRP